MLAVLAVSVAALALSAPVSGAASKPKAGKGPQPYAVSSTSLVQSGQQVIWSIELSHPFSPSGLHHDGRSLCLLIERAQNGSISGQICIVGPARGSGTPRLEYMPITVKGPGPGQLVSATIARSSSSELTATFVPTAANIAYQPLRLQVISTLSPPACVPPRPNRVGCELAFPNRPTLVELHTPQLVGCVATGPEWVFNGPTNVHEIALTFDDGPWTDTSQFLDILEREHVVATFFEVGEHISTYGEGGAIERRMLADGDMIGDHTWSHPDVAGGGSFAAGQIEMAADAIRAASGGFTPCLFRAPYGDVSSALLSEARALGYSTIQWDIDPRDWAEPGVGAIYSNVIANARNGAIIIQHDGGGNRSETIAALPSEIDTLRSEGYQFVTITQMLGYKLIYK
jgi:peptidoglycan/xylan/chitin deacetylase (PgdA/CDA1 family)